MSDNTEKSFRLRLPEALYNDLEKWADEEVRSVNGQIIIVLREAVAKWKAAGKRDRETKEEDILTPELVAA